MKKYVILFNRFSTDRFTKEGEPIMKVRKYYLNIPHAWTIPTFEKSISTETAIFDDIKIAKRVLDEVVKYKKELGSTDKLSLVEIKTELDANIMEEFDEIY